MRTTVLLVSFNFPPYAEVSSIRAMKYCKFLPEFDWTPWVLTIDPRYYGTKRLSIEPEEVRHLTLVRFPYMKSTSRTFASLCFPFFLLWIIAKHKKSIDAVCMIGSPYHPFLLTPVIRKIFNLPTLLDFRDSWSHNYGFDGSGEDKQSVLIRIKHRFFFQIEKIALQHCSAATFSTSVLRDEYASLIPAYKNKYHVIYNGYDEDDFARITPKSVTDGKTILLAGKFHIYTPQAVAYFLQAVKEHPDLTFIYIGNEQKTILQIAEELDIKNQVVAMGYQPYTKVLQYIAGSDFCLLSNGLVNGMGTKIFDYLALKKPTMCLVPKGSIIARQFGDTPGIVISEAPHSKMKIRQNLNRLLMQQQSSADQLGDRFSRKKAAKKLAALLDNISGTKSCQADHVK